MAWLVALRSSVETSFAEELPLRENPDHRFLAVLGQYRHLHLAPLDEEDRVGDIALAVNFLVLLVSLDGFSRPGLAQKRPGIKGALYLKLCDVGHGGPPSGGEHSTYGAGKFRRGDSIILLCPIGDINRAWHRQRVRNRVRWRTVPGGEQPYVGCRDPRAGQPRAHEVIGSPDMTSV
jgi:hypothetical protein